jgi:hypothetical protein
MEIFYTVRKRSRLAEVELYTSGLVGTEAFSVHNIIWFKESPQEIVCDFATGEERNETSGRGGVRVPDVINTEIKLLHVCCVGGASIRFELRKEMIQDISLDLLASQLKIQLSLTGELAYRWLVFFKTDSIHVL